MFSWRARRQLTALLVVASVMGVIFIINIRKVIPASTCFDGRQNQGETETDCGGPCASCELKHPKGISIFWTKFLQTREGSFDLTAYIQNQNETLSSSGLEYEFVLFDDLGVVAYRSGKTFIYPRERIHLVEAGVQTSRRPTYAELKITKTPWNSESINLPVLTVDEKSYKILEQDGGQGAVEATVSNRSSFGFREAELVFVLLDKDENLIGVNRSLIDDFLPRSGRSLRSTWPEKLETPARIIIEPRINLFKTSAILQP